MNHSSRFNTDPVTALLAAVKQAFPHRPELARLDGADGYLRLWQNLVTASGLDEKSLAKQLAPALGLDFAQSLDDAESAALSLVPVQFCLSHKVLPLYMDQLTLVVATGNPFDESVAERLNFLVNRPVKWVLAAPDAIEIAATIAYGREATRQANASAQELGVVLANGKESSIVTLGRAMLTSAIEQRASDLHIQPFVGSASVRVRVDGMLRRVMMLPDAVAVTLIRHFKAKCGMDSTNSLIPQDGRMTLVFKDREFDMRVSVLPATHGERLVIRFLEQGRVRRLSGAGFSLAALQTLRRAIRRPSGMVILTGPTGCGKTSTLYGMLSELNSHSVNIITVENPVEYRIPGISQVEVNEKAGRGFATVLRSILRQDPDIVLIGEIRDAETAEIAVQASLTGHLVLSTLHTNDAMTAIPRLLDLGIEPTVLADSLAAVAAQRLCRTLCSECRTPIAEPYSPEEMLFLQTTHNPPRYRSVGCKVCDYTGFFGRLPIVDIVEMTPALRDAIAGGQTRLSELEALRDGGLKSLAASGSLRIISGDTTVREVVDTVGPGFWSELARHYGTTFQSDPLDTFPEPMALSPAVLLISSNAAMSLTLNELLQPHGYRVLHAATPDDAHALLVQDEEIVFVVGDVDEHITVAQAQTAFLENRARIAWARLPAAILLPASLAADQVALRDSGVMGTMFLKPLEGPALVNHIRRSRSL
ncbi:GspE/PulE family protein [Undibacterium parvum]|uniref:Type II/IV secretion system protein n=1 Tax=Undibacterium piscinae TaxID=2495591 RepID=A0A6M4A6J7_9BURK|nr:GspE/PulE family protein [Undibacterium parvum]QJQ06558.1 type II/IV secretion system protein [Undibacterium piscinae]